MPSLSIPNNNENHSVSQEKNLKPIKDILEQDLGKNSIVFSPIFGNLKYLGFTKTKGLKFQSIKSKEVVFFRDNGTYADGGNVLLYPSEEDSNWENVPIRYPQSKSELIDSYCRRRNTTNEIIEALRQQKLYFHLRNIAIYLDSLGGSIKNKRNLGKNWVIQPEIVRKNGLNEIEWDVKRKLKPFYHIGFYNKKAAEIFLNLMKDDIERWTRQMYKLENDDVLEQEATALINYLSRKNDV